MLHTGCIGQRTTGVKFELSRGHPLRDTVTRFDRCSVPASEGRRRNVGCFQCLHLSKNLGMA